MRPYVEDDRAGCINTGRGAAPDLAVRPLNGCLPDSSPQRTTVKRTIKSSANLPESVQRLEAEKTVVGSG